MPHKVGVPVSSGFFVIALATAVLAQAPDTLWTRTYGERLDSDYAYSVEQTSDGGYILAGATKPFFAANDEVYLIKTDSAGDTLWARRYGGEGDDQGKSVHQTSDGGYIIAGWTESFGAGLVDFYLIKTDSNGDTLWTREYGGAGSDYASSVDTTSDGGYIIGGYTNSFGAGVNDLYLVKTDADGDTLWTRVYGGVNQDECRAVRQTADGGYIAAGATSSFGSGGYDVYLVRTDASGDSLWSRVIGGGSADRAYSLDLTPDGGCVVAGYTGSFGAGVSDVYLLRINANGDTLWTKTYGGLGHEAAYSVKRLFCGGYVIAGYTDSCCAGGYDVYVIRTDSGGDTLWTRAFGASGNDYGRSVQETSDCGYVVAGDITRPSGTKPDAYLIRIDSDCSGVDSDKLDRPTFSLWRTGPNPLRDMTSIRYSLSLDAGVHLRVVSPTGQEIRTLVDGVEGRGDHLTIWDGRDNNGRRVAAGVYLLRLEIEGQAANQKLIVVR